MPPDTSTCHCSTYVCRYIANLLPCQSRKSSRQWWILSLIYVYWGHMFNINLSNLKQDLNSLQFWIFINYLGNIILSLWWNIQEGSCGSVIEKVLIIDIMRSCKSCNLSSCSAFTYISIILDLLRGEFYIYWSSLIRMSCRYVRWWSYAEPSNSSQLSHPVGPYVCISLLTSTLLNEPCKSFVFLYQSLQS